MDKTILLLKTDAARGMETLIQAYTGYVYTICKGRLQALCSKSEIEECVADVFADVYECRNNIDEARGSLKAFICTVARKKAADAYTAKSKLLNRADIDDILLRDEGTDIEGTMLKAETAQELLRSIRELGRLDSEIFLRKYYFGQSTKEIAKAIGLKENTIDNRVSRGYAKLRRIVKGVLVYDE